MKKRFAAFSVVLCMLVNLALGTVSGADGNENAYGHQITYKPVTQLYTGGEPVKFFDSGITSWGLLSDKITRSEDKSVKWLDENGYLLNHFGRYFSGANIKSCFNSKGEWLTKIKGPTNVRRWDANISFKALTEKEGRENGNISNMYNKGDLQYFFSWKVKTVQTRWGLTGKSNDTGDTYALEEWVNSKGGGWKKYNTIGDGPNLGYFSAWKSADRLNLISFTAKSDKDAQVDSYMSGAMLVGRDIKGPKINSVTVTADAEGKNVLENGTVTLENINKLNNRTVYFQVEWDEPVEFKNLSLKDIGNLSLKVDTIGIDGTSGIIAEAPFLKFAPSKKDGKPVMVFEYKIADPYTDSSSVTQERGYFYKFSKVTVSENQNETLWNNIYDISGNKFASDENANQPSEKVICAVGGLSRVDLMPFGIKNIRVTKIPDDAGAFVRNGDLLSISLELNKPVNKYPSYEALPSVSLNVLDPDGNDVVLKPDNNDLRKKYYSSYSGMWKEYDYFWVNGKRIKTAQLSNDSMSLLYYVQLHEGYKIKNGTSIKVTSVSSNGENIKDESGYSFMDYALNSDGKLLPENIPSGAKSKISSYAVSPDKQYKVDYESPVIDISMSDEGYGIIMMTAVIDDISLEGCDASFAVKANGKSEKSEGLSYQASASKNYDASNWVKGESNILSASFGAPIINENGKGISYGFIKLPDKSEVDEIDVSVAVSDEAGNNASVQKAFSAPDFSGFDTLAPTVNISVNDEIINVEISDIDDEVTYEYGFSEDENAEPLSFDLGSGKTGTIDAPSLPEGNEIHTRVLWIKAKDSRGNESGFTKLPVKYDRTYTEIKWKANTEKQYFTGEYPMVEYTVANAVSYWYVWAEKPANVSDTASYISEKYLDDMKQRAKDLYSVYEIDETEENLPIRVTELDPDTAQVASVNPKDESYGENISLDETSRPVMLIIGADKKDGGTLIKTIEFNTMYGAPKVSVRQSRFSTNNSLGKRVDYTRNGKNASLLWADDDISYPINTPLLYGVAQAEFYLEEDPVTNLERVDLENSFITLERVVYDGDDASGQEIKREVISEWKMSETGLGNTSQSIRSMVLDIDPKTIDAQYYEFDEEGNPLSVRYEFVSNFSYIGNVASKKTPVTYFAFNNTPSGLIEGAIRGKWGFYANSFDRYEKTNIEAVLDKNGNDITQNIPVYTFSTYDDQKIYIRFTTPGGGSSLVYYRSSLQNTVDESNTAKLAVRIGTSYDNLSDYLVFNADSYQVLSEPYFLGDEFSGAGDEFCEKTLYYRFENPESGEVSPIYVLKVRRDNFEPVIDVSVSETERKTNEVLVKLNGVYDTQTAPDGTTVIDTPETVLQQEMIEYYGGFGLISWRIATENDDLESIDEKDIDMREIDYDWETGKATYAYYIRVLPDENGVYHFTSNGYFMATARDYAGKSNRSFLINGKKVDIPDGADYAYYEINNVDNVPPKFEREPEFSENESDGSFKVSAKADNTVKNVYFKFDGEYSKMLSDSNSTDDVKYDIKNVPGAYSASFDEESGEINAEIYVKHFENTSLLKATLIIEDGSGNTAEYEYDFKSGIYGKNAEITNTKNENGYPVYTYGESLDFSVPVKVYDADGFALSHENLPIYSDGITQVEYTDLFGDTKTENVYADIFGAAFSHDLIFTCGGKEITPQTYVSGDVTVKIDTGKTKNLVVDTGKTEFTFNENGVLDYSLTNTELSKTKKFSFPIVNIDKTAPEAIVNLSIESETDIETNEKYIYSLTYTVEGFSEDNVSLMPSDDGAMPYSVTFDIGSENKKHTFRFCDAAGNEGSYTADASDVSFSERKDNTIADYRLTYLSYDSNGFKTLGEFSLGDKTDIGLINSAVSVKVQALNKNGENVSFELLQNGDLPSGSKVYEKEKLVMFTSESGEDRKVNLTLKSSRNSMDISVVLPSDTIDLTAPSGSVYYVPEKENIKAYLVTSDTDLEDVYVIGTTNDGKAFELKKDETGYYTEFSQNGVGKFVMTDKAGNIGTVAIAVLTIDKEPPKIISEGWQSVVDAKTEEEIENLLKTPTNSSIKLFITFNEQLRGADVKAYKTSDETQELLPTDEYVTAAASGSNLTLEFKKNCRAKLTVYDLRGNALTIWRPEDGPITVIDKDIPKLKSGYPKITFEKNKNIATIEYVFEDDEKVMLLQNHEDGYKNKHTVTVSKNGLQTFNFADMAGNVFSDYPVITNIDELAPSIKMSVDYVGEGNVLSGNDSYKSGNVYTSKNVRILLNVSDETADEISVKAKTKSGAFIPVNKENVVLNEKTYNYNVIVTQNGAYRIIASDKWGHENVVETSVSVIDKTAPSIKFENSSIVVKTDTDKNDVVTKILENVTAEDNMSGANSPLGDKFGDVDDGVKISVNADDVNLSKEGKYTAKITASDRLGNTSEKDFTVIVKKDLYKFNINGKDVYANDVFTSSVGKVKLKSANDNTKFYYMQGYKTLAQMKYGKEFNAGEGFDALIKGYYTICAQEAGRKMYLIYVYVY